MGKERSHIVSKLCRRAQCGYRGLLKEIFVPIFYSMKYILCMYHNLLFI